MKTTNKIDVHHHIFPADYVEELNKAGVEKSIGSSFPSWTPETSLKHMKKNGVQIAMQSITAPGVYMNGHELPDGFAERVSRRTNEVMAETIRNYPENFGGFATIPLLNEKAAIEELSYALDTLKLDGVCLMTNYHGKYLGDVSFEPFFAELNKRKAVVFIHPTNPGLDHDPGLDMPDALIDAPFDTTRAVTNLMHHGTLDRFPDIKYILSHGGGTIPYLAWRLAAIAYSQHGKRIPVARTLYDFLVNGEPTKGLKLLKRMYYDTANVSGTYQIEALRNFAGPDQMVFGTDLTISKLATIVTKNLEKDGDFSDAEFNKISYGNCLKIFPSLEKHIS